MLKSLTKNFCWGWAAMIQKRTKYRNIHYQKFKLTPPLESRWCFLMDCVTTSAYSKGLNWFKIYDTATKLKYLHIIVQAFTQKLNNKTIIDFSFQRIYRRKL